jgi:TetR/AcrR family tetracycline transcriptional repressor
LANPRGAGRKPLLTQQSIVDAALRLVDRDGLDALTIRSVAAELGVKSASLYWHFPSKETLLDRLADEVLSGLAPTAARPDWRATLRDGALALFRHLRARRDAARLRAGRLVTGPNTLRLMEAGLSVFVGAGFSPRAAAFASHALHIYVLGSVIFAEAPLSAIEAEGATAAEAREAARRALEVLPPTQFPTVTALAAPLTEGDAEARFLYGLDRFIDGIAAGAHP